MRVALVNQARWPWWNVELARMMAALDEHGHEVHLIDLSLEREREADTFAVEELKKVSPEAVGIIAESGPGRLSGLLEGIRSEFGAVPFMIGSMLASFDRSALHSLENLKLERVFTFDSDADVELAEFLLIFERGSAPANCHISSKPKNLDSLPLPDFRRFDMPRYFQSVHTLTGNMPIYASQGCSFQCSFCNRKKIPYASRSSDAIIEEILIQENRHRKHGMRSIIFHDNAFGLHKGNFNELMMSLRRESIPERLPWSCQTRPELITKEWVREAARAGCFLVSLGLENGIENVRQDLFNRRHTNAQFRQAVRNLRDAGIEYKIDLLVGIPQISLWMEIWSLVIASSYGPAAIYISPYCPVKGTRLGEQSLKGRDAASVMTRSRRLASLLKILSLPPLPGITRHGLSYLREVLGTIFNIDGRRCLPLFNKLTANHIFHRPIFDIQRRKYLEGQLPRKEEVRNKGA